MTSQPLLLDDGLLSLPKTLPVVIQVHEVPITSPTNDEPPAPPQGPVEAVEKLENGLVNSSRAMFEGLSLKRPRSGEGFRVGGDVQTRLRRQSSLGSIDRKTLGHREQPMQTRPPTRLPHFRNFNSAARFARERSLHRVPSAPAAPDNPAMTIPGIARSNSMGIIDLPTTSRSSWLLAQSLNSSCGIVPPLTPPEDLDSFKWGTPAQVEDSTNGIRSVSNAEQGSPRGGPNDQRRPSSTPRPSEIRMPDRTDVAQDESNRSNWLGRACQHLVSALGDPGNQQQIQMVVQALPSQLKSAEVRPVFEKVVEEVQNRFTFAPYITITHAVSQVISMDEVPASPPATPNANYSSDDYFQDQTIFTHAAVVPAYHSQSQTSAMGGPRPTSIIAAPSSIHTSILERYIPPVNAQEVHDFFTLSRRSYLADRLLELSANNGTLLLVYPTKTGASTFASKYIGPVMEPFLRQFILLNSLYTEVAIELGQSAAVSGMKDFEEMRDQLVTMCRELSQRAPSRGLRSRYEIVHAETAEVILDRTVWKEWYIEQEQPRLRQTLVDYHKAGGRMPSRNSQFEVTPGQLAREVVEGIRQSREAAGNTGIEVGVFVIRRSTV